MRVENYKLTSSGSQGCDEPEKGGEGGFLQTSWSLTK